MPPRVRAVTIALPLLRTANKSRYGTFYLLPISCLVLIVSSVDVYLQSVYHAVMYICRLMSAV